MLARLSTVFKKTSAESGLTVEEQRLDNGGRKWPLKGNGETAAFEPEPWPDQRVLNGVTERVLIR
jgi:hypothetical protein